MTFIENRFLQSHYLLDYKDSDLDDETQTNILIVRIINNICKKIDNNKIDTIILEYQDDIISLISYRILKIVQLNYKNFNLYIYGKRRKTRKAIKEKSITKLKVNKLLKLNSSLYVSSYNPIYNVVSNKKKFNKFYSNIFFIMRNFTVQELQMARLFYHIGYYKNDILEQNNDLNYKAFERFCSGESSALLEIFPYVNININELNDKKNIYLVRLNSNIEQNINKLQQIEGCPGIVIYLYEEDGKITNIIKNETILQMIYEFNRSVFCFYNRINESSLIPNENEFNKLRGMFSEITVTEEE